MKQNASILEHILALGTIFVWGTTFISTKHLLLSFKPVEILFFRFVLGALALYIAHPYRLKVRIRNTSCCLLLPACAA